MPASPTNEHLDRSAQRRRALRRAVAARSRAAEPTLELTTVVLDLGGVVVPTLFEVVRHTELPGGPFGNDPRYAQVEQGGLQERDYWAELAATRKDLDVGAVMRSCMRVRAEIRSLLASLGGRVRIAALTNDMAHWFGADWAGRFAEFAQFDVLLEATRSGSLKPDPAVFRWALERLGEPAHACLFVDDLPSNLRGARAAGMHTEHFDVTDPQGSTERLLHRVGVTAAQSAPRTFRVGGTDSVPAAEPEPSECRY